MAIRRKCRPRTPPTDSETVRLPVLRPVVLVILILLAVFTACIYRLQERQIEQRVRDRIARTKSLLREARLTETRLLRGMTDCLLGDPALERYWRAGDRGALLKHCKPYFDEWRSRYQITHFYLLRPDRLCFLRVHDPNRYGDRITRVTLERASRGDNASAGLELGPLGTVTLRVVHPWHVRGELLGYLELGEEIDRLVTMVKQVLDVELIVATDKSYLDRRGWEEGMRMLGRPADWNSLPAFVVNDHTFGPAVRSPLAHGLLSAPHRPDQLFDQTIGGRQYRGGVIILSDAVDRPVGRVAILCDIGAEKASLRLLLFMLLELSAVVAAAIAVLFGRFIRDIERRLTAVYADLKQEIQRRTSVEEELRRHQDHLEDLVRQRTQELETSNHDLKSVLRIAAHDLKAPIRAVGTLTDWIRDDCADKISAAGREHLDLLSTRAQRLSRHIDRILEYAEISSAPGPAAAVDLHALVHDLVAALPRPEGISVVVEDELPTVLADRSRMTQLFENLLSNAIRYMNKPVGVVTIGCVRQGEAWRFHVADTGGGIESRFFSKIFEMFQTLSPRDEVEATGMGLPIVKRIVELYGGTIWVESVVGQGSTFFFTLPLPTPVAVPEPQEAVAAT
jgi:signal transduction histidine kinase